MPEILKLYGETEERARALVERLTQQHYTLALAESCTAGLVSDLVARVSGASAVLWGSFVCYSPGAKRRMLGINAAFLRRHGLVSGETARKMALHALNKSGAAVAAAVTGLAGPLGDGSDTPVGTVCTAVAMRGICRRRELHFQGSRAEIRMQAAAAVLEELLAALNLPLDK
ncbi:MAG: CinA family protein [Treponema sp.]|jgi:PncC family amidohydrolase|nr:CinA family protein [Treponema sp.]